jgi:RHS repeat-associated protein
LIPNHPGLRTSDADVEMIGITIEGPIRADGRIHRAGSIRRVVALCLVVGTLLPSVTRAQDVPGFAAAGVTIGFAPAGGPTAASGVTIAFQNATDTATGGSAVTIGFGAPLPSAVLLGKPRNSAFSADPVNTATGNYVFDRTDLAMPGRGIGLAFSRFYNSLDAGAASGVPLGIGWTHSYQVTLKVVPADQSVEVRWGDGHTDYYNWTGSSYVPRYPGLFDTLTRAPDGTFTIQQKTQMRWHFTPIGSLDTISDRNGNAVTLTYDGGGRLTTVQEPGGRTLSCAYDAAGHITAISDPLSRSVQFAYDGADNLVSSTDPAGGGTTYTYDANHQMLTARDPRGNAFIANTYDPDRKIVTWQADAKGNRFQFAYDTASGQTTITDPLGHSSVDAHDVSSRLVKQTDRLGYSVSYTYDNQNNRTSITDKNGNLTTYSYDAAGNVLTKTDPLSNVTAITYDANNNPLTRTDALNQATQFTYDAQGNLITTTDLLSHVTAVTYDAAGLPLAVTDPRHNTTTNTHDAQGNLTRVTNALDNHTDYTYDGVGRRLTVTDARGHTATFTYDANNNLLTTTDARGGVTTYTYDENNNRLSVTDPRGKTTTSTYDVKDLLSTTTDALSHTETNTYDKLDRKTAVTDQNGHTTGFAYDPVGNLIATQDPLLNTTSFTYDGNGDRLIVQDPLGKVTTSTYDTLNRVTQVADALTHVSSTEYDALGRVTATVNAKSQKTKFSYDKLGRLLQVTDAANGTVTYTYDENGNRRSMTDPNQHPTTYDYDELNRITLMVEPLGNTTAYRYDAVGNLIQKTDPNGHTIQYAYDELNRLATITYPDASTVTFTYDPNGNRTQMVDSLGTTTYQYDELNRMTQYTDPFGKIVGYGYDPVGNRTTLTYPGGNAVTYAYDPVNRMTGVTDWSNHTTNYSYDAASRLALTTNPNGTTAAYTYDDAGRLTALTNAKLDASLISNYAYTLDEIGNQLHVDQTEPLPPVFASHQTAYTYDTENRMTSAGGTAATFDNNGNMMANGADSIAYDFENRLTQSTIDAVTSQYLHDGRGNRLAKTVAGMTTRYVLDVNRPTTNILAETDGSGTMTASYVYGLGMVARILPDGSELIYHYDSRGSTIGLTDASGKVTDAYSYDPFGAPLAHTGATVNSFTYVGRHGVMDDGNGLAYVRARYYMPATGRFLTKDPQTGNERDGQSLHRYIYALNNPVRLIDISGLSAQEGTLYRNPYGSSDTAHAQVLNPNTILSGLSANNRWQFLELLKESGDVAQTLIKLREWWDQRSYGSNVLGLASDAVALYEEHEQIKTEVQNGQIRKENAAPLEATHDLLNLGIDYNPGTKFADWLSGGQISKNTKKIIDAIADPIGNECQRAGISAAECESYR